jgi:hypothetical protein
MKIVYPVDGETQQMLPIDGVQSEIMGFGFLHFLDIFIDFH